MPKDSPAESALGSSTEDCPIKFSSETDQPASPVAATADGAQLFWCPPPASPAAATADRAQLFWCPSPASPAAVTADRAQLFWCPSPGLQLRLENLQGLFKLKSYRTGLPKCPLCWNSKHKYYCQECVVSGNFVHTSTKFYESFADKNLRLFSLQRDIAEAKAEVLRRTQENLERKRLKEAIRELKTKIKYIRHVIRSKKARNTVSLERLERLKRSNTMRVDRLPEYVVKVEKIHCCLEGSRAKVASIRANFRAESRQLDLVRRGLISSLQDIFPVEEVFPVLPDHSDLMLDCLAEAMRTSYIHGRWVSMEQSGEKQYKVVVPLLSGSGDYTPVYALIATSKEGSVGVEPQHAFNISAGLTLITQLIKLVARFTSVPLPIKLSYADFGVIETSEYKFAKKVAKLNLTVISLALALGVDPLLIRPCQTVHNVILIVQHILEGRSSLDHDAFSQSDLQDSYSEFAYFEAVHCGWSVCDWESGVHRESEELRSLEDTEEEPEWEQEEESLQEWESVVPEDVSENISSSPSNRTMERPPSSSLNFVSSTMSSLFWGITSPKSPRK